MTTYVSPFTGQTVSPSQVGYESLALTANTALQWPINGNNSNVVANIIDVTTSYGASVFQGYISGSILTVTAVTSGAIAVGQSITGNGITTGTTITALGTGTGSTGTYTVNISQNVGCIFTGSTAATTLTVASVSSGSIANNQVLSGSGVTVGTTITAFGTGTGGAGTYSISVSSGTLSSRSMTTSTSAISSPIVITLPSAQQVSTGQSILIRNTGSFTFTLVDYDGNTILSLASGVAYYVYLTSNTTNAGTWATVTFGAGVSSANASTLAGYGLLPINSTLNQAYQVTNYYSSHTLDATNRAQFAVWSSGVGTITLPSASTVGNNWFVMIRNNGTGILTIVPSGTNTIDNNNSVQLQLAESFVVVSNGSTGYNTFGYGQSATFVFTQLSAVVTGGTLTETVVQAANIIQEFTGALTSNQIVVLPSTVQFYTVTNSTTGPYSFTLKTSAVGGATVIVPQSSTMSVVCDGTNVFNASSAASSTITALTLGNGNLSVPSLKFVGDLNSGLFLPATGQMGFVIGNNLAGYFDSTGFYALNGINGGGF